MRKYMQRYANCYKFYSEIKLIRNPIEQSLKHLVLYLPYIF